MKTHHNAYNNTDTLESILERYTSKVACIVVLISLSFMQRNSVSFKVKKNTFYI